MSKFNVFPHFCAVAVLASFLSACGGGSGGDGVVGTGNSPDGSSIHVDGAAQKGPYLKGSEVLVSALSATGVPSTDTTLSEIQDDMGTFAFQVAQPGPVLIAADGYHFNEITGSLSQGRLLLRAVYNATSDAQQKAYVNVLTHLSYKRTLTLLSQGTAITDAMHQAEADIVQALRTVLPVSDVTDFTQLSIYNTDTSHALGNAYVLALSATVYEAAILRQRQNPQSSVDAQLTALLNDLSDDVADDGQISRVTFSGDVPQDIEPPASSTINYTSPPPPMDLLQELIQATRHVRPDQVRANLEDRSFAIVGQKLPVADLDLFLDSDGDGMVNAQDSDDDNDGIADAEDASPYVYSEAPVLIPSAATGGVSSKTPFTLEWTTSEYAKQIEVQLAKDDAFTDIVLDELAPAKQYTFTLDAGIYYVRARAQNELGGWGPWSLATELPVDAFARAYVFSETGRFDTRKFIPTSDGGIVVSGTLFDPSTSGSGGAVLVKIAPTGLVQWRKQRSTSSVDVLKELPNGDLVFVSADDDGSLSGSFRRLIKIDGDGNAIWQSEPLDPGTYSNGRIDVVDVLVEPDGFAVALTWNSEDIVVDGTARHQQVPLVVKLDVAGKVVWRQDLSAASNDFGQITETPTDQFFGFWKADDGNYRLTGYLRVSDTLYLASLASDGTSFNKGTIARNIRDYFGWNFTNLPDGVDGFNIVIDSHYAGDLLYSFSEIGQLRSTRFLYAVCDCADGNPQIFVESTALIFGGASGGDGSAMTISRANTISGAFIDSRVYAIRSDDAVLAGLDMNAQLFAFSPRAEGGLFVLGGLNTRVQFQERGFILIKTDPNGNAPKALSQTITVTP